MRQSTRPNPDRTTDEVDPFLTSTGRLPGFAQRRLDLLIGKSKVGELDRTEKRELREMLEFVDRKSVELLRHARVRKPLPAGAL